MPIRIHILSILISFCVSLQAAEEKPNFVIILADDVSWSSFGCVEAGLHTHTPNIDKLASQGMRFSNFSCSAATCAPTRHELYTGLLPPSGGVYGNGDKPSGDFKNIVNYLSDSGYNVGLTGKVHFNTKTEFQKIPGFTHGANAKSPSWDLSGVRTFMQDSQAKEKPFCVIVASVHAHHPWTIDDLSRFPLEDIVVPPHMVDTPKTREALAMHAAEVLELDNQGGATMELLDSMNLSENTVMIFLSEQGTALPNGKWSIYDFGTKALCLVRWPGKIQAGTVTDAVAMYCDITPTLVDIAGGEAPQVDGQSLLPVLLGNTSKHREHAYLVHQSYGYTQRAIRNKDFKLIWSPKQENTYYVDTIMDPQSSKFFAGAWREWIELATTNPVAQAKTDRVLIHPEFELYNIQNDPWELNNLADKPEYAQLITTMHAQLKADMDRMNDSFSTTSSKPEKKKRRK